MNQMQADIVIVSAGTAGLAAAVAAAEKGADVLVFEKRGVTGGTGNVGSMVLGIGSDVQKKLGIDVKVKDIFNMHMEYTHFRPDARLVRAFYDKSGDTINWLMKHGVEFKGIMPGRNPVTHGIIGGSYSMMKALAGSAREMGVRIEMKTTVTKILKENGKITGVMAVDSEGEEIKALSKAVIVAAGGFGDNPEWIKQYTGFDFGIDMFSHRLKGLTGDGIRMAWEVGAAASNMTMQTIFSLPAPYHGPNGASGEFEVFVKPELLVNLLGERFLDEDHYANGVLNPAIANAICRQKGRCCFLIFDEATRQYYAENYRSPLLGPGGPGGGPPGPGGEMTAQQKKEKEAFEENFRVLNEAGMGQVFDQPTGIRDNDLEAKIRKAVEKGYKHLFVADSIEYLAAQTGIDLEGLTKTVAEYNRFCDQGRDETFEKDPAHLRPVKTPKFYAARFFPSAYGTLGGIRINYRTEVVDREYRPIPGLYAGGVDANDLYGDTYERFLGGNTQGFAINSGRIAGENAADYVKGVK